MGYTVLEVAPEANPRSSSGWEAGAIFHVQSGTPFTVYLSGNQAGETKNDNTGAGLGERPDVVLSPECKTLTNPGHINNHTNCFTYAAPVTWNGVKGTVLGNLVRNAMEPPGLTMRILDDQNDKIGERFTTHVDHEPGQADSVWPKDSVLAPRLVGPESSCPRGQRLGTGRRPRQPYDGMDPA